MITIDYNTLDKNHFHQKKSYSAEKKLSETFDLMRTFSRTLELLVELFWSVQGD